MSLFATRFSLLAPGRQPRSKVPGRHTIQELETGNWKLEAYRIHRGGIALNVFSMFSNTASVERTPASR